MADSQDGQPYPDQPYPERSQTPDMQGAGMPAISPPSAGLLDVLGGSGAVPPAALATMGGGGGGIPNAAIMGLMSAPPSQLGTYAAALSGGISAMRGKPDPVQEIQQNAQKQQNAIALMMEKMQDNQRLATQWGITNERLQREEDRRQKDSLFQQADTILKRKTEKEKLQLAAYDNFLASATKPETRKALAEQKAAVMKNMMGVDVPEAVIQDWTLPSPVQKERNDQIIQAYSVAGDDPVKQQMVADQFRLDPKSVQFYTTMVKDDGFLNANGVQTKADQAAKQTEREIKEQQLIDMQAKRNAPELAGDQKFAMALKGMAGKLFPGREYGDLDTNERNRVGDALHNKMKAEEEQKMRLQSDLSTDRLLAGIDARLAGQGPKPTNPLTAKKFTDPFQKTDTLLDSIALVREKMKGIPDDALPQSDTWASAKWATGKRNLLYAGDQNIFAFQQLWAPISIGQIDRGYFDDKGVRIAAAFGKQLEVTNNLPTRKTMNAYLDTLEQMVTDKMVKDYRALEGAKSTPPDVLDSVKGIVAPRMPRQPGTPINPSPGLTQRKQYMDMRPGSKTYNQPVWGTFEAGDRIPPGLIEIK